MGGGLTAPAEQRQRTWYVGCASESQALEYPQAGEAGSYEFTLELEVAFDGETFHPVASAGPQLAVQRPCLAAFELVQAAPDELEVRVQIEHLDPAFALPVNLELWKLGGKKSVAARRCALLGGALVEAFAGLKALGLKAGDQAFALLSLAPGAAARPVPTAAHWLDFDGDLALPGARYAAWIRSPRLKLAGAKKAATTTRRAGGAKPKKP